MKSSILKATAVIFGLSLISKLIGFLKSIVEASYFGATINTDAYNIANGFVSNVLYMFATAIAIAFVPLYIQRKNDKHSIHSEKGFATSTITFLSIFAIIITCLLLILSFPIIRIIAPSFTGEALHITVNYFRVLVLGFSFSLLASLYTYLLNSERVYGYSAACSIINSIVLICGIVLFADIAGVWVLVISIPISYFIQFIILFLRGKQYGTFSLKNKAKYEDIKLLLLQATPILLSQATVEINQVVDRTLLTMVSLGAVTAVAYSAVLYQFATSLINMPISTVLFTELSEAGAKKESERIKRILIEGYTAIILICVPVIAVMFFCSSDIVMVVYGHGRFSGEAVINCAIGLKMYSLCLLPVCIKTVLTRAYFALNDSKRPMVIGMLEVALNIILSILLYRPFGIYGVVGATAIASMAFVIVMLIDYNKSHLEVIYKDTIKGLYKFVVAAILLILVFNLFPKVLFDSCLIDLIIKALVAFIIYLSVLVFLRERMINGFIKDLITKLTGKKQV